MPDLHDRLNVALARDPHHRPAQPPAHPAAPRFGRGRRPPVLRDAVRRRRIAPGAPAPRRGLGPRRRAAPGPGRGHGAGTRASPGHHPSRREARERPLLRGRTDGRRLRHRTGDHERRRRSAHPQRLPRGHARVHESRAGDGRLAGGRPHRRLRPRVRGLRTAGRRDAADLADRRGTPRGPVPQRPGGTPRAARAPAGAGGAPTSWSAPWVARSRPRSTQRWCWRFRRRWRRPGRPRCWGVDSRGRRRRRSGGCRGPGSLPDPRGAK